MGTITKVNTRMQWIDITDGTYPVASLVRQRTYDGSQGSYLHALAASLLLAHAGGRLCAVVRQVRVVEVVETENLVDGGDELRKHIALLWRGRDVRVESGRLAAVQNISSVAETSQQLVHGQQFCGGGALVALPPQAFH